ncbi:aminotransferase class IV [Candidatus Nanopelagicales bacterium]|nr:aminotransferase class IV [Candidatus Nanopelagicales bacterium]
MICWLNGHLTDVGVAQIRPDDHGFTIGDGVFETLITKAGVPFALTLHLARLAYSAKGLGLPAPNPATVRSAVAAVVHANRPTEDGAELRIRITYTAGPGPAGSDRSGTANTTLCVTASPALPWPDTTSLGLAPWPRNERSALVGLKTTSYAENAIALAWAKTQGHAEALLVNLADQVCEGTGSNVFAVIAGEVVTPPLTGGCLAGITRALLLRWCQVSERTLTMSDLRGAQEVFITSSTRDVHPVRAIDDVNYPTPGPRTQHCQRVFAQMAAANPDPTVVR